MSSSARACPAHGTRNRPGASRAMAPRLTATQARAIAVRQHQLLQIRQVLAQQPQRLADVGLRVRRASSRSSERTAMSAMMAATSARLRRPSGLYHQADQLHMPIRLTAAMCGSTMRNWPSRTPFSMTTLKFSSRLRRAACRAARCLASCRPRCGRPLGIPPVATGSGRRASPGRPAPGPDPGRRAPRCRPPACAPCSAPLRSARAGSRPCS